VIARSDRHAAARSAPAPALVRERRAGPPAHARRENEGAVQVLGEPTAIVSVTIVPRFSGRLRVHASVIAASALKGRAVRLALMRSGRKLPIHTAPASVVSPCGSTSTIDVEIPEGFRLGEPVELTLVATGDGGLITVATRGARLEVREAP
jgi:hypothetical protein